MHAAMIFRTWARLLIPHYHENFSKGLHGFAGHAAVIAMDADDDFVSTSPAPSQPSGVWLDAGMEEIVYSYLSKRVQVDVLLDSVHFRRSQLVQPAHASCSIPGLTRAVLVCLQMNGGSFGLDDGQTIYRDVIAMFPPGAVTEGDLRKVFAKKDKGAGGAHSSPRDVQKERSPSSQSPAAADALGTGTTAATAAAPFQQQRVSRSSSVGAPAPTAASKGSQEQVPALGQAASLAPAPEQATSFPAQDAPAVEPAANQPAGTSAVDSQPQGDATKPAWQMSDDEYGEWLSGLVSQVSDQEADVQALAATSASFKRGTAKAIIHAVGLAALTLVQKLNF